MSYGSGPRRVGSRGRPCRTCPTISPASGRLRTAYRAPITRAGNRLPMLLLKTYIVEDSPVIRESLIATLEELVPVKVVGTAEDEATAMQWLARPGQRSRAGDRRHLPQGRFWPGRAARTQAACSAAPSGGVEQLHDARICGANAWTSVRPGVRQVQRDRSADRLLRRWPRRSDRPRRACWAENGLLDQAVLQGVIGQVAVRSRLHLLHHPRAVGLTVLTLSDMLTAMWPRSRPSPGAGRPATRGLTAAREAAGRRRRPGPRPAARPRRR